MAKHIANIIKQGKHLTTPQTIDPEIKVEYSYGQRNIGRYSGLLFKMVSSRFGEVLQAALLVADWPTIDPICRRPKPRRM